VAKTTKIYTIFTDDSGITRLLFSPPTWCRVRITLETAGPVAVGTSQDLGAVLSGQGVQLTTDIELTWDLDREDRLFWVAESINRVKFSIESIAYGDEYAKSLHEIRDAELGVKIAVVAATPKTMRQPDQQKPLVVPRLPMPKLPVR
jgi:hypothetical protein